MASSPQVAACVLKAACFSPHAVKAIRTDSLDARSPRTRLLAPEPYGLAFLHLRFTGNFFPVNMGTIFATTVAHLQRFAIRSDVAVVLDTDFSAIKAGWSFRPALDLPRGSGRWSASKPSAGGLVCVRSHISFLLRRRRAALRLNYAFGSSYGARRSGARLALAARASGCPQRC